MMQLKHCNRCDLDKPIASFHVNRSRKDGRQAYCKVCRPAYRKHRCNENPILYRAAARRHNLRFCFGMSIETYNKMLTNQNGVCAICKQLESIPQSSLSVDHNHMTKTIRALLCRKCNAIMGYLEGPYGKEALDYMEKWAGK